MKFSSRDFLPTRAIDISILSTPSFGARTLHEIDIFSLQSRRRSFISHFNAQVDIFSSDEELFAKQKR